MELLEGKMEGTLSPIPISTRRQQIAKLAKDRPELVFTTLAHHLDMAWLLEAFRLTRKNGAVGVDGQTAADYQKNLEVNLLDLLDRAKSGRYFAPPVRRVHIPKGSGTETRPIGIPTFEDKVLQRAIAMLLEAVYEQDFLNCSYGFRPGRSAHDALQQLWDGLMTINGGYVLEVDIRKFFDTLSHKELRQILGKRVRDGVVVRLIGKWLNAGVLEDGNVSHPDAGTPQGGVISPLLANVLLHEVLDAWFEKEVKPRMKGRAFMVRYADDAALCFAREEDARRVMDVLPKRFGKYGLALHPEKTRLVRFKLPGNGGPPPQNFDMLGFTHFWSKSRRGTWVVKRKTASTRFTGALQRITVYCRAVRHHSIADQHEGLSQKLRGHYGYYGITGNSVGLSRFQHEVVRIWKKWLSRRGQRGAISWQRYLGLLKRFPLPQPVIAHSSSRRHTANP